LTDLTRLTLAAARNGLTARQFTSSELTGAYLNAIEGGNSKLNAYVAVTAEQAQAQAKASDAKLLAGQGGPLEGIPLGIKDLFGTRGVHTQAASHILDSFKPNMNRPSPSNLWRDGAVMLGKLNMDEFAMGSSNETSYYGPVINPWRAKGSNRPAGAGRLVRWFGRCGFGLALCAGATATDTGGSIRQPAALTGTVGIKPTYGRCSRWGVVAFASSLDQAGPIARDRARRRDPDDFDGKVSMPRTRPASILAVPDLPRRWSVGQGHEDRHSEANIAWKACRPRSRRSGSRVSPGSRPRARRSSTSRCRTPSTRCRPIISWRPPRHRRTLPAMTASSTACASTGKDITDMYELTRAAGFGPRGQAPHHDRYLCAVGRLLRCLLRAGPEGPHADQARFRAGLRRGRRCDPDPGDTVGGVRHRRRGHEAADPVKMYLNDVFTVTVNMAGLPGIAVPAGKDGARACRLACS
jgi:aspartyl-tRNA(Asn)/glutamyl-tRNA(Gln) amidotransferase subunit A